MYTSCPDHTVSSKSLSRKCSRCRGLGGDPCKFRCLLFVHSESACCRPCPRKGFLPHIPAPRCTGMWWDAHETELPKTSSGVIRVEMISEIDIRKRQDFNSFRTEKEAEGIRKMRVRDSLSERHHRRSSQKYTHVEEEWRRGYQRHQNCDFELRKEIVSHVPGRQKAIKRRGRRAKCMLEGYL